MDGHERYEIITEDNLVSKEELLEFLKLELENYRRQQRTYQGFNWNHQISVIKSLEFIVEEYG